MQQDVEERYEHVERDHGKRDAEEGQRKAALAKQVLVGGRADHDPQINGDQKKRRIARDGEPGCFVRCGAQTIHAGLHLIHPTARASRTGHHGADCTENSRVCKSDFATSTRCAESVLAE